MAKVLLVEDDTNLREIFEMRLQAEGYDTVTAGDGEQALVVAMKQKPDLIIADVMMPHLSGFEMLETLRAAPEMAKVKVVMMTALGQAEDQARGEKLGVIKYLVKSQVTLEDFARVIREVLPPEDGSAKTTKQGSDRPMQDDSSNNPAAPAGGPAPAGDNPIAGAPADDSAAAGQQSMADAQDAVNKQVDDAMAPPPAGGAPAPGGDVPVAEPPADEPQAPADGSTPPAA